MGYTDKLVYDSLASDTEFYNDTCDIKFMSDTRVNGLSQFTNVDIATDIKCELIENQVKFTDPEISVSKERNFTLYLLDAPLLKDDYYFTNFKASGIVKPNAKYVIVKTAKFNQIVGNTLVNQILFQPTILQKADISEFPQIAGIGAAYAIPYVFDCSFINVSSINVYLQVAPDTDYKAALYLDDGFGNLSKLGDATNNPLTITNPIAIYNFQFSGLPEFNISDKVWLAIKGQSITRVFSVYRNLLLPSGYDISETIDFLTIGGAGSPFPDNVVRNNSIGLGYGWLSFDGTIKTISDVNLYTYTIVVKRIDRNA